MVRKNAMTLGLEKLLNSKEASPLNNPAVFKNVVSTSGMSISSILKYTGKQIQRPRKPTDDEKSKERIQKLEAASEK
tara:strand:+ start:331 stop:561 length:231 start_codon:yes stop_codon:yes gene_type:complete